MSGVRMVGKFNSNETQVIRFFLILGTYGLSIITVTVLKLKKEGSQNGENFVKNVLVMVSCGHPFIFTAVTPDSGGINQQGWQIKNCLIIILD